jgi:predicted DNA binding CopG/RHH family protein
VEVRRRRQARAARYARAGRVTFREDRRVNIRLSSKDLDKIQKRALFTPFQKKSQTRKGHGHVSVVAA